MTFVSALALNRASTGTFTLHNKLPETQKKLEKRRYRKSRMKYSHKVVPKFFLLLYVY